MLSLLLVVIPILASPLSWTLLEESGPEARDNAGLVRLNDRLLLFGGRSTQQTFLDDLWVYNFNSSSWSQISSNTSSPQSRDSFVYGVWQGNFVIAMGRTSQGHLNDVWLFNITDSQWYALPQTGDIPHVRYGSSGGVHGNRLWVTHGFASKRFSDTYFYDLLEQRWVEALSEISVFDLTAPHARCLGGGDASATGQLMMYGGCAQAGGTGGACPSHESWVLDLSTLIWRRSDGLNGRVYSAVTVAPTNWNADFVMLGGDTKYRPIVINTAIDEHQIDVFAGDKWFSYRALPDSVSGKSPGVLIGASIVSADTSIFAFGGRSSDGKFSGSLWQLSGSLEGSPVSNNIRYFPYSWLHGIFMALSWTFCFPIGILFARYGKRFKYFFHVHRAFNITGVIMTVLALILAVVGGAKPGFSHGILGLIIIALALLQPINGVLRPHHGERYRAEWELLHKNTGRLAMLLAVINVTLGLFYANASFSVFVAYWVWLSLVSVLTIVLECNHRRAPKGLTVPLSVLHFPHRGQQFPPIDYQRGTKEFVEHILTPNHRTINDATKAIMEREW